MARAPGFAPIQFSSYQLKGGLDLVTPPQSLAPGVARDSLNFEVSITGGYTRIAGYERFDGRPAPSAATLGAFKMNSTSGVTVGTMFTTSSGASGLAVVNDGTSIYYTMATGAPLSGDTVSVGGTPVGTVTQVGSQATGLLAAQYQAAAADAYRAVIQPVPGSGPVRGVAYYAGSVYAWRDNTSGTALGMYKSSGAGWTTVLFGSQLSFSSGTTQINDGATITGGSSGATAIVMRAVLESGAWGAAGAGRLIVKSITGTFTAGEAIKVGATSCATMTAVPTQITLLPGGNVQTVANNFGGAQPTKLYGCDGLNCGWEFDGTTLVPIRTGMASDTPQCVVVHKSFLFFAFGPSIQFSALNLPYQWSAVVGAGEIVTDNPVTGFSILPGNQSTGALGVFTTSTTYILYGTGASTWQMVPFNTGLGATFNTVQNMEQSYQLADRGVVSMNTSKNYGNFDSDTLTLAVRPFIQAHRGKATAAGLNREKGQYRIFYSDGYGLYITINNGTTMGAMPVYFPNPVYCWCEGPSTGTTPEASFFGSSNGYVYMLDAGTSCDGQNIDWALRLNFNAIGNAREIKRFRKAALEVNGTSFAQFNVGYDLSYADATIHDVTLPAAYTTALGQNYWDAMYWESFYWDGRALGPIEVEMTGSAENVALAVTGSSNCIAPFTINTTTIHYSPRRALR
jgi:hypothetical protein